MNPHQATVGTRVVSLVDFCDVPAGTQGVIDEDYGSGVMVAWDQPGHPLPPGYCMHTGAPMIQTGILRDGFDKSTELQFLDLV